MSPFINDTYVFTKKDSCALSRKNRMTASKKRSTERR